MPANTERNKRKYPIWIHSLRQFWLEIVFFRAKAKLKLSITGNGASSFCSDDYVSILTLAVSVPLKFVLVKLENLVRHFSLNTKTWFTLATETKAETERE